MKKTAKLFILVNILVLMMTNVVFGNQWSWESVEGQHNQSILSEETVSRDRIYRYGRGDYLAEAVVQIVNNQDGRLRVDISTYAHVNVDKIMHTVFIDVWDEDENDWINLDYWDFEITKEEVDNNELHVFDTSFFLSGYEVGRYYRLRGLHGVEIYDELEACATETDGVMLTDLWN